MTNPNTDDFALGERPNIPEKLGNEQYTLHMTKRTVDDLSAESTKRLSTEIKDMNVAIKRQSNLTRIERVLDKESVDLLGEVVCCRFVDVGPTKNYDLTRTIKGARHYSYIESAPDNYNFLVSKNKCFSIWNVNYCTDYE